MAQQSGGYDVNLMRRFDLVGTMRQSTNPFLMEENDWLYLRNVTADELGSISKDGGYTQYGTDLDTTGFVESGADFIDESGNHTLVVTCNGTLYKASNVPAYTSINNSILTAGVKSDMKNFLGNLYITNGTDGMYYTDGTTLTSVDSDNGGSSVIGDHLEVIENVIFLGNIKAIHTPRDVVYSVPGGHIFYNGAKEGANTYATTDQKLTVDLPVTGLKAFQGLLFIFTEEIVYYWNPKTNELKVLANTGTPNGKSIVEINGVLYWANRDGVYRFNGSTLPELISIPITNWTINSLWRLIDGAEWGDIHANHLDGKYLLSVGNLVGNLPGDDAPMEGVIIVYDTYRDIWSFLEGYPISFMTRFINSDGNLRLIMGHKSDQKVLQKDYSYSHNGSAINMVARTKYFTFGSPENEKVLKDMYFHYRPSDATGSYITVRIATNGSNNYETKLDDTSNTKLQLDGVPGTDFQMERVSMDGKRCHSISYEFSNADNAVNMTLLGYTQEYYYLSYNKNLSTD